MSKFLHPKIITGIVLIITLVLLSIVAYNTGWSGGAEKLLTASLVLIGAIPIREFFH